MQEHNFLKDKLTKHNDPSWKKEKHKFPCSGGKEQKLRFCSKSSHWQTEIASSKDKNAKIQDQDNDPVSNKRAMETSSFFQGEDRLNSLALNIHLDICNTALSWMEEDVFRIYK